MGIEERSNSFKGRPEVSGGQDKEATHLNGGNSQIPTRKGIEMTGIELLQSGIKSS